jgi:hypothetical protein
MGRASRRKKARKQSLENKTFIISESVLRETLEALNDVGTEDEIADSSELPDNRIDFSPCATCDSTEAIAALSATVHWAEWRCVGCGRHRGWIENPKNSFKRENENQLIDRLLRTGRLNTWERMFCQSVSRTRKRSPRQIEKLTQIASRLGISAVCEGVEA